LLLEDLDKERVVERGEELHDVKCHHVSLQPLCPACTYEVGEEYTRILYRSLFNAPKLVGVEDT
jgi:hypothetical protein